MKLKQLIKKKAQVNLGNATSYVMLILVLAIVAGAAFLVLSQYKNQIGTQVGTNSTAYTAVENLETAGKNFTDMTPIVGTILGAALILGIVFGGFLLYQRFRS